MPGHISVSLAEKIFFIGESIQLFEADKRIEVQGEVLKERETDLYQQLVSPLSVYLLPLLHLSIVLHSVDVTSQCQGTHTLTPLFQTELRDKQEFRISEFERFVDGIRETASKHLHTLVLERADLKVSKIHNGQVSLQD